MMKNPDNQPNIIVLEDDVDQMLFIIDFALSEINTLIEDEWTSDEQRKRLKSIKILKVADISSLYSAATKHKGTILAILDCNTPDTKGAKPHDQFIKTKHVITGQHRAVDIVTEHLPQAQITMISSMNRFRTLINRYYATNHGLSINFIGKKDAAKISQNIRIRLKKFLKEPAVDND